MGRACSQNGEGRSAFKILRGKPAGRPRRSWDDNIRMDLKEIGINAGNWLNAALSLRVP